MNPPRSIYDIDFDELTKRKFTPSPDSWNDQVLYFLMLDRFSDGSERGGFRDNAGKPVKGGRTPLATPANPGAVSYDDWIAQGHGWQGGTFKGLRSKLGYLRRLGVTAIWISPVFKQVCFEDTYHGYGIQNFLEIDPHFGTREDLRDLVDEAHRLGIYCILDIILNHCGNVFGYKDVRYQSQNAKGEWYPDPRWDGKPYVVEGFRDKDGKPTLPFNPPDPAALEAAWPEGAIWPRELQAPDNFMQMGRITNWDHFPEFVDADFCNLRKLRLSVDWSGKYPRYSSALRTLSFCYFYWIAYADVDGFRIDTVKHMGPEATRFFCTLIHEFAESIGKERFLLAGEVTGGRRHAWTMVNSTGLNAALGIDDLPQRLENVVTGCSEPREYFGLFRNSQLDDQGDFAWFGQHVITMFDDHDQVRKGGSKSRFCGVPELGKLAFNALALDMTTAGIPCIYYGTEQSFDSGRRPSGDDAVLRENMFGGRYGGKCTQGVHHFNEDAPLYQAIARLAELRRQQIALRRGRQFLHEVSGDGEHFGEPKRFGDRLLSLVTWSRVMGDYELLMAFNTDENHPQEMWTTLNPNQRRAGEQLDLLFSYGLEHGVEDLASTQYAPKAITVEERGNVMCVRLKVGPAGFAIYSAGRTKRRS